jgi:hypothetical protein
MLSIDRWTLKEIVVELLRAAEGCTRIDKIKNEKIRIELSTGAINETSTGCRSISLLSCSIFPVLKVFC